MTLRDPISSASHLLAALWAMHATAVMLRLTKGSPERRLSVAIFGSSMVALYLASGVYHGVSVSWSYHSEALQVLQTLDRSAIFVLIAGTNTPVMVMLLPAAWRRACLWGIWVLAIVGIASLWGLQQLPFGLVAFLYIAMGWLGGVPLLHYVRAVGWRGMAWAGAGGLLYTLGAVCDVVQWPTLADSVVRLGPHEVFHLATVAGSVAFYIFMTRHVIRYGSRV